MSCYFMIEPVPKSHRTSDTAALWSIFDQSFQVTHSAVARQPFALTKGDVWQGRWHTKNMFKLTLYMISIDFLADFLSLMIVTWRGSGERSSCTRTRARFWVMLTWIEEAKTAAVTPVLVSEKQKGHDSAWQLLKEFEHVWTVPLVRTFTISRCKLCAVNELVSALASICGRGRGEQEFLSSSTLEMLCPWSPYKHMTGSVATIDWHWGPVRQSPRRHLTHLFLSQELIRFTFWYWMISMYRVEFG